MIDLRSIALALGGVISGRQVLAPGPGHSAQDRSLAVRPAPDMPDGLLIHSHAGDDWRDCRDYVSGKLGISNDPPQLRSPSSKSTERRQVDRSAGAIELWKSGLDPRGTIVERYLKSRGLELPDDVAERVVQFHAACPWRGEDGSLQRRPVMLTAFRLVIGDRLVAVHRTLLSDDGRKIDRRMLGPVAGAAIKIDPDHDVEQGLNICEGFETGLAGRELGFRPVWALGSAGAIAAFPVLPGIDALTILAETDDSGANARAVKACGNRWAAAGCEVIVATPRVAGDMNDALRATDG
jgi:putative DNA primase/helicase